MKNTIWYDITLGALVRFNKYRDAKFDIKNGINAQPLIGKCSAISKAPATDPQNDICSSTIFILL